MTAIDTVYHFCFQSLNGEQEIKLSDYKDKVILIVNTASQCGFTPQYAALETLYNAYKARGFVVLGVPSNNFGCQEPADVETIQKFCDLNFHITFPLTEKCNVKGKEAHPFYEFAFNKLGFLAAPKWNFHKYLINKQGELVDWFSSTTNPSSDKIINKIVTLL